MLASLVFIGTFIRLSGVFMFRQRYIHRAGFKPIAPNWVPRPILQTLVQVNWEPGPTEIVPNWAPHLLRSGVHVHVYVVQLVIICIYVHAWYPVTVKTRCLEHTVQLSVKSRLPTVEPITKSTAVVHLQ